MCMGDLFFLFRFLRPLKVAPGARAPAPPPTLDTPLKIPSYKLIYFYAALGSAEPIIPSMVNMNIKELYEKIWENPN